MIGNNISSSPAGEMFDDAGIGVRDDENRKCGAQGKKYGKIGMIAEGNKRLGRPVGRGGNTVSTETYPCKQRKESNLLEYSRVFYVFLGADEGMPDTRPDVLPVPGVLRRVRNTTLRLRCFENPLFFGAVPC
jgi:hypothetical protein